MYTLSQVWTKRLLLRPIELADASDLLEVYGDFEAVYGLDVQHALYDIDEVLDFMKRHILTWQKRGVPPTMALELQTTGTVIGIIEFHRIEDGTGEIGYHLARAYWHQGYMQEALTMMIHIGFTHLQLHRIEARYTPKNTASAKVLERCHFVKEGCLRKAIWLNDGKLHDMVICAILKEEYERWIETGGNKHEKRTRSEIRP